jgi:formyltetrahydrofolate synthetase
MKDIIQIAKKLTIKKEQLILYGNHKAKINIGALDASEIKKSKLILVTSITPTKAGQWQNHYFYRTCRWFKPRWQKCDIGVA